MKKKYFTLKELQVDLKEFDKEYWVAPMGKVGATRHITLHLAKLMGKIGEVTERWDHGFKPSEDKIKKEVIPDLLIYGKLICKMPTSRGKLIIVVE